MQQGVEVWRPLWPDMCGHLGRILYGGPPVSAFLCCRPSGGPDCRSLFSRASRQPRHSTLSFTARVERPEASSVARNMWGMSQPCRKGHTLPCGKARRRRLQPAPEPSAARVIVTAEQQASPPCLHRNVFFRFHKSLAHSCCARERIINTDQRCRAL